MRRHLSLLLCTCVLASCTDRDLGVLDPKVSREVEARVLGAGIADVDLLIVVDDSGSMEGEQTNLAEEIPSLVRGLASPPDEDGDGAPDWHPAESLRVAVVTTDLGTSGQPQTVGSCSGWGDGAALRVDPACDGGRGDAVQSWQTGDDPDAFASRVGCVARAGIAGCGIEQQLDAGARGLRLALAGGSGFPRDNALLAVLVLTDEEDCSLADPAAFFGTLPTDAHDLQVYCTRRGDLLRPVADLAREISLGRPPDKFVFSAITGVPIDFASDDLTGLLASPAMEYVERTDLAVGLQPACESGENLAVPARRIVELARQLPGSLVRSICADSFQSAIAELTRRIGGRIQGVCIERALVPDAEGGVDCVVRETLPEGTTCEALPARTSIGLSADGLHARCEVAQAPGGAGSGWFYDATDPMCNRVAYTSDAIPPLGTDVDLQCVVEVDSDTDMPPTGP